MKNADSAVSGGLDAIELYAAGDSVEAHSMANLLREQGIKVHVVGDLLGAALGGVPFGNTTSPKLCVARADLERARQLVSEIQARRAHHVPRARRGSFQVGLRTLFVNLTIVAVVFAIAPAGGPEDWRNFFAPFVFYLILGNLMAMAYYRKKRSAMD